MKVKLYKSFYDLHKHEQTALLQSMDEAVEDRVYDRLANEHVRAQKKWLKMLCIDLHDKMKMTPEECILAVANFREIYITNSKMTTDEEQEAWLNSKMVEIFGEGGYPEEFIKKMEKIR